MYIFKAINLFLKKDSFSLNTFIIPIDIAMLIMDIISEIFNVVSIVII